MNFSSTTLLLTLLMAIAGGSASARGIAVENLDAGCHAHPMSASRSEGRWTYRTIRATGQKCWFLRTDRRTTPREPRSLILAFDGIGSDGIGSVFTQSRESGCLAAPNAPSPRNTRWRYRFDKTGQRCWHLASSFSRPSQAMRKRTSLLNKSSQPRDEPKKNDLKQLRSVADTNDSLLAAQSALPQNTPNAGQTGQSEGTLNEGTLNQAFPESFEARWMASTQTSQPVAPSKVTPAIPRDDIQSRAGDSVQSRAWTETFLTADPPSVKSGKMPRFLLTVVGSVAIAMGLFALINGALRSRVLASKSYAVGSPGSDQSLPDANSSIADILERLNKEDQS
ncbi:MAG: hypothetical protein KGL35_03235 [Bradyrhizobium sp.]|nr:hypothetical protein [Bradyrhizobium sp.]